MFGCRNAVTNRERRLVKLQRTLKDSMTDGEMAATSPTFITSGSSRTTGACKRGDAEEDHDRGEGHECRDA